MQGGNERKEMRVSPRICRRSGQHGNNAWKSRERGVSDIRLGGPPPAVCLA